MIDRELLELAAKAAGFKWWQSKHGYWNVKYPDGKEQSCCVGWAKFDQNTGEKLPEPTIADAIEECGWNPFISDGAALRLAVKLGMRLELDKEWKRSHVQQIPNGEWVTFPHFDAPYAATRRAIVSAATEIGKGMK